MANTRPTTEQIRFTQEGTGAVERELESKLFETISVKDFGAVGDGVTDDKDAIQAAIDHVETLTISPQGAPVLIFPPGKYLVGSPGDTSGIDLRRANLKGSGSFGCTFVWGGDIDGTLINYRPDKHKKITGFRFDAGTNQPKIWIDCQFEYTVGTGQGMDWGDTFNDLFFTKTSASAGACHLNFPVIVNLYMRDIRFQASPNLIRIEQSTGGSSNRIFSLHDWTVDFQDLPTGSVDSLINVDTTGNGSLTVDLQNARIECTSVDMGGTKAIVNVEDTVGPNNINVSGISLVAKNLGIQLAGTTGVSLLYQDTTQTNVTSDISLENVFFSGVDQIHGGNWNAFFSTPEPSSMSNLHIQHWITGRNNDASKIQFGDQVRFSSSITIGDGDNKILSGSGLPEGSVVADKGSIYLRTGGGAGFSTYIKTTDTVNTGWINNTVGAPNITGGAASAGSGNQHVQLTISGTTYKLLHDGTV